MGFSWENQLYGGLTVLFKKGNALKNQAQVETLLNQAAVSIKRLLAEKSLRASEERFRHISDDNLRHLLFLPRRHGGNLFPLLDDRRHRAHHRLHHRRTPGLKCWGKLVLAEDLPDFEKHVTGLAAGNSGICELRLRHKNGDIVWVQSFAECIAESRNNRNSSILFRRTGGHQRTQKNYERAAPIRGILPHPGGHLARRHRHRRWRRPGHFCFSENLRDLRHSGPRLLNRNFHNGFCRARRDPQGAGTHGRDPLRPLAAADQ